MADLSWYNIKKSLKWFWWFVWEDDSWASWIVSVIIAFVLVKFVIYPVLGLILGTSFPVVAVVSGSMEHNGMGFEEWWQANGQWYEAKGITEDDMHSYRFRNGFNKGDIMIILGVKPENIKNGMVIVYSTARYKYPIIHRVVDSGGDSGKLYLETKGDNNSQSDPEQVPSGNVLGRAVLKIPYLGWIKLVFTSIIGG
ncbi:MAG: signal peptidase I [Candidatus Woesearchaeota archaeon]